MARIGTSPGKDKWKKANRVEQNYSSQIQKLFKPLFNVTEKMDDSERILSAIESMFNSPLYQKKSEEVAKTMATMVYKDGAKNWKQAAKKSSRAKEIYAMLRMEMNGPIRNKLDSIINYNATLIKTLPLDLSRIITKHVQERSTEGLRASEIAKEIKEMFPKRTRASATLIARTETSKASTALTQARSELLGHDWYVWRTSEDARVRSAHAHMDGVICNFKHPPSPELLDNMPSEGTYNAGEIYNCRCYAEPLIDYVQVRWPAKVNIDNRIQTMTLDNFKKVEEK